jgi:DNA-binding NtrC family response regulator
VIAATNRELSAEVAAGRFREDLYYRLAVVRIDLPLLRERREDIGLLASYFLARISERQGKVGLSFSPEAMALLERYDYPGNVRELENAIEHAVTLSEGRVIRPADLPTVLRTPRLLPEVGPRDLASDPRAGLERSRATAATPLDAGPETTPSRDSWSLADVEREHILRVLDLHRGNATSAARQLGISRTTLWRKMRQYGLQRSRR